MQQRWCFSVNSHLLFLNVRISWISDRKFEVNVGRLPFNPISKRSFKMPYFHFVSYAFSMPNKMDTACSFLRFECFKTGQNYLPCRHPHCILEKSPLDSRNHTKRALIIISKLFIKSKKKTLWSTHSGVL